MYGIAAQVTTSQPATPLWVEIPAALSSIVTAAALIIGGGFAYMKFVRGRILHPACALGLSAKVLAMADGATAIAITATVTNAGSLRLLFPLGLAKKHDVIIYSADAAMWADAIQWKEVLWTEGFYHKQDLLTTEGVEVAKFSLEPGEILRRELLVPLPTDPCVAYRIAMRVEACPQLMWRIRPAIAWENEMVLMGGEPDER